MICKIFRICHSILFIFILALLIFIILPPRIVTYSYACGNGNYRACSLHQIIIFNPSINYIDIILQPACGCTHLDVSRLYVRPFSYICVKGSIKESQKSISSGSVVAYCKSNSLLWQYHFFL